MKIQVERKSNPTEARLNALVELYSRRYPSIRPTDHRIIIKTCLDEPHAGVTDLKRMYEQRAKVHGVYGAEFTISDFFGIEPDLLLVSGGEPVFQELVGKYYPNFQTQ